MTKKSAVIFMSLMLTLGCFTACNDTQQNTNSQTSSSTEASAASGSSDSSQNSTQTSETTDASGSIQYIRTNWDQSSYFADGDTKTVTADEANATITLSGSTGTISDTTRGSSGSEVTITSKGIYRVTGSSDGVSIIINDSTESGNIYLILDNVTMTNASTACINVQAADKVIIVLEGENSLTYTNTSESEKIDGAVYSKDNLTINGTSGGKLNITSSIHGIVCKDNLKIIGGECAVNAGSIGIKSDNSYIRLKDCKLSIVSGHDGVKMTAEDTACSFYADNATIDVNAQYDGISLVVSDENSGLSNKIELYSGSVTIKAGGGSDNSKDSSTSQKGIKCSGEMYFCDCSLNISSADDGINNKGKIYMLGGSADISTSDDGITSDEDLIIEESTLNITKSYEALEAANVTINSGDVKLYSSDDGINCAGGSDTSSSDNDDRWNTSGTDAKLTINGGNVYVNANGDGLDSNGSIYITGGTVIVEGPTDSGNGALDKGDGNGCVASITGGTVLAIGSSGMAVNFDTGTQCSALVQLSGSEGTEITVDDGSGFTFTTTQGFECVVYSSPSLTQGSSYTLTAGSSTAALDFSSGLYYSDVSTIGGGPGGQMGGPGGER